MTTATAAPVRIAQHASAKGCAAGSGSLTGACSPASSRPSATARCSSGCCTSTPTGWSSSPPAPGATAGCRSPPAGAPTTSSPAAAPVRRAGSRRCSSSPRATPTRGEEVFVAPAARAAPRGDKHAVSETRFLWVDVDRPGQLPALWAFLAERPCHLLIASGGSGGVPRLLEARPSRCRPRG